MKKSGLAALSILVVAGCAGNGTSNGNSFGGYSNNGFDPMSTGNPARDQAIATATKALTDGAGLKVTQSVNEFGFKAFTDLKPEKKNSIFSPMSLETSLAMVFNGAAGETRKAMNETLGFGKLNLDQVNTAHQKLNDLITNLDPNVEVKVANSIWADKNYTFKADFLKRNTDFYSAKVSTVDFKDAGSAKVINDWVKDSTNGRIPEILDKVTPDTAMYLLNAVSFRGKWASPFNKDATKDGSFKISADKTVTCPMMNRSDSFDYARTDDADVVSLPYGSGRISMVVILPGDKVGLAGIIKKVNLKNWQKWTATLAPKKLNLSIPKFKVSSDYPLNETLKSLGMGVALSKGADFSAMEDTKGLYIGDVLQKAVIDVNEEGTEAAASTGVKVQPRTAVMGIDFKVDHPFLYMIRDTQTGAILFMGTVTDPS